MPSFASVFARLFTIQAAWNYERMQGVGFGHAAEPALRALDGGRDGERYRAALARQARFFNSHPYFAGLAVGAAVRAELEGERPEKIERLRATLGAPLGSLGDRLIWASWLPVCAAIGIVLFALGAGGWAAVVFLALYNVVHVGCRWWSLRSGWRHGMTVATALHNPAIQLAGRAAAPLVGLAVGLAIPLGFAVAFGGTPARAAEATGPLLAAAAGALLFALAGRLAAPRLSGSALAAVVLGVTWVAGLLW